MFDWSDYLDVARGLAEQPNNEAAQRSAISRAYYAAFCTVRNRLRQHDCSLNRHDVHRLVWQTYRDCERRECSRIGELGFNLRDRRNKADYDDTLPFRLVAEVQIAVQMAERIIELLDELPSDESCC